MRFINCSNHPSEFWGDEQLHFAKNIGKVIDLPFPKVPGAADEDQVDRIAEQAVKRIVSLHPDVVMCQGEYTVTFRIVTMLKALGVRVVSACSERDVQQTINEDGEIIKEVKFHFVQFRNY